MAGYGGGTVRRSVVELQGLRQALRLSHADGIRRALVLGRSRGCRLAILVLDQARVAHARSRSGPHHRGGRQLRIRLDGRRRDGGRHHLSGGDADREGRQGDHRVRSRDAQPALFLWRWRQDAPGLVPGRGDRVQSPAGGGQIPARWLCAVAAGRGGPLDLVRPAQKLQRASARVAWPRSGRPTT